MDFRIGTRGSKLARTQAGLVRDALADRHPEHRFALEIVETTGDRISAASTTESFKASGATKGAFVKEIEEALLAGRVHFAIHSAKDLPAEGPEELRIAAYPKRASAADVLIFGRPGDSLGSLGDGDTVGTSSPRRGIQMKRLAPAVDVVDLRGNVDTRLKRLAEGRCGATILASAGLSRLGLGKDLNLLALKPSEMVPAPAQGALALQVKRGAEAEAVAEVLDHRPTREAVEIETRFLKRMGGGCNVPLGAYAEPGAAGWTVRLFYSDLAGSRPQWHAFEADSFEGAIEGVEAYARTLEPDA